MARKRILMVYPQKTSFVKNDVKLLTKFYVVKEQQFYLKKRILTFFYYQIKGLLKLIINAYSSDLIYVWFNDYHAFWACLVSKILNKKIILVVGGYDAVSIPKIKFGLFYKNNFRTKLARWTYKNVSHIIPVDATMIKGENLYAGEGARTGILNFMPDLKTPFTVIPTGYSQGDWYFKNKKKQVLTVGQLTGEKVFRRKGIDLFLQVAKELPEVDFIIVGLMRGELIEDKYRELSNVKIYPMVDKIKLSEIYAESQVYAQFSLSEGLPNVLCEAMMSECVPVGSRVNGIPEAIGETGYVIDEPKLEIAKKALKKALNDKNNGKLARGRILTKFPISNREYLLRELINKLLD